MKKVYTFLATALLTLAGLSPVMAQDFAVGDRIETVDALVGQQFFLTPSVAGDGESVKGTGYLTGGSTALSSAPADASIFVVEPVGKEVDGSTPLYYLKSVKTGLYVKDPALVKGFPDDESSLFWTADKAQAMQMTVLPYDTENADSRSYAINPSTKQYQDLETPGYVFTRSEKVKGEGDNGQPVMQYYFINGYENKAWYYPYYDTNVWYADQVMTHSGADKIMAYLDVYFPKGVDDASYPTGGLPGTYNADSVKAAIEAYNAANSALQDANLTNERADEICAAIKDAAEKLVNARIPLSEGYYFIYGDNKRWFTTSTKTRDSKDRQEFLTVTDNYEVPDPLDAASVSYIWKVSPTENADQFLVQNVASGSYINGEFVNQNVAKSYGLEVDGYPGSYMTLGAEGPIKITLTGTFSPASWNIATLNTNTANGHVQFHSKYANGGVMTWNANDAVNNCYHFQPVSEADLQKVLALAQQEMRNNRLQQLYDDVKETYNSGIAVKGAPLDATFNGETALVKSDSQLFSSFTQAGDGQGLPGALDGDFSTYWHSKYDATRPKGYAAYIGVDLEKAISGGLSFKFARRATNRLYPLSIRLFGSNEVDTAKAEAATWIDLGVGSVSWTVGIPDAQGALATEGIGTCGVLFDGSYRYFKVALVENELKTQSGEGLLMALSEFNAYPGVKDDDNSLIKLVSEATVNLVNSELAKAAAQLKEGKATEEQIASLQAAYDALVKELPVPSLLTEATNAAQTVASAITEDRLDDTKVAYYNQKGLDAFKAAIDAAKAYDTKGKTAAEINAEVAKVNEAVAVFHNSWNLPKAGSYVIFRGMSDLHINGNADEVLNSWKSQVYAKNSAESGALYFTRSPYNNDDLVDGKPTEDTEVNDTVQATEDARYLWYVEKSGNGKVTLRNVGTGMYFAPGNDEVGQSFTPAEASLVLPDGLVGRFMVKTGESAYINAPSWLQLISYSGGVDANNYFTFEEVPTTTLQDESVLTTAYWDITPGVKQILTLPFSISESYTGTCYSILGKNDKDQLVLADLAGSVIEAGTPFIFDAFGQEDLDAYHKASFGYQYAKDANSFAEGRTFIYATGVKEATGLVGTLTKTDTIAANYGYLDAAGLVKSSDGKTAIGPNSGWIDGSKLLVTSAKGDATIDLDGQDITSIDNAAVVVLPKTVNVYGINGALLRSNVKSADAAKGLPAGLYIIGGQKVLVK